MLIIFTIITSYYYWNRVCVCVCRIIISLSFTLLYFTLLFFTQNPLFCHLLYITWLDTKNKTLFTNHIYRP